MIKPTALWNLVHECEEEDAENLGKILLLCAGKEVELDRAWRIHANVVLKDAADLDERIEEKRAKETERKRKNRAKDGAAQDEPSRDVTRCPAGQDGTGRDEAGQDGTPRCPAPYIHTHIQTYTHTNIEGERKAPAPESVMFDGGELIGVPRWYTAYWIERMRGVWHSGDHDVTEGTWRKDLKSWFYREKEIDKARIQAEYLEKRREVENLEDTNPAHWKGCKGCGELFMCGYMCNHAKVPPKDPEACPHRRNLV